MRWARCTPTSLAGIKIFFSFLSMYSVSGDIYIYVLLEWADYSVQVWCGNLSGKRAHTQLVKEYSATVVAGL